MKRISKLAGLVSKPLQRKYLVATPEERASLHSLIEKESEWMVQKMARKGYRLEATVADVYGLFTRGAARGTVRMRDVREPVAH